MREIIDMNAGIITYITGQSMFVKHIHGIMGLFHRSNKVIRQTFLLIVKSHKLIRTPPKFVENVLSPNMQI